MKRYLWLIIFVIMLFNSAAMAEINLSNPDLSHLTNDELLRLSNAVEIEKARRTDSFNGSLGNGVYTVGKDIAEGRYRFTVSQMGTFIISAVLFESYSDYESEKNTAVYEFNFGNHNARVFSADKNGDLFEIELNTGNVLMITAVSVDFEKLNALAVRSPAQYMPPEGVELPMGIYVVGIDIAAGSYQVFFDGHNNSAVDVYYRRGRLDSGSGPSATVKLNEWNTESRIALEDENVIVISVGSLIIKKAAMIIIN